MKLVSWNVNGLRACLGKGFLTFCDIVDADVICLQETKMRPEQAEFEGFYLVCCYTPNSQDGLKRVDYRMLWEDDLRAYLTELDKVKPVVLCGDLNVAREDIDLKNPDTNHNNPGFSDQERGKLEELLSAGFADSFRRLHPDARDRYSWWSFRTRARERNVGWRIDYFILSERLLPKVRTADILDEVLGSDHCPVLLDLED